MGATTGPYAGQGPTVGPYSEREAREAPQTGLPKVFDEQCSSCIFRPGNPMRLREGRLREVVEANLREGAALICHQTTYEQRPELGEVVCAGWFTRYGSRTNVIQIMARLAALRGEDGDGFERVSPTVQPTRPPGSIGGDDHEGKVSR
jgi:hypothetical protein